MIQDWRFDSGTKQWDFQRGDGHVSPNNEGGHRASYDGRNLGDYEDAQAGMRAVELEHQKTEFSSL